jgi:thiol-disulfide isomerase/thioredoxin
MRHRCVSCLRRERHLSTYKKTDMKKLSNLLTMLLSAIILTSFLIGGCNTIDYEETDYLKKVLNNLEEIKSAVYYKKVGGYPPGDTAPSRFYKRYVKEYNNPTDTTIGSSFINFPKSDTNKMSFCYDGKMRARVNWEEKYMEIDSFRNNPLPFRPLNPPFFNYTASILRYALNTKDSITTDLLDLGDSVLYRLTIYDSAKVEFFGRAYYDESPYGLDEEVSKYTIWIKKSNSLPYKVKREMSHNNYVRIITEIKNINKHTAIDFKASKYFPDYPLRSELKEDPHKIDLLGKTAPNWTLKDSDNQLISLDDLKSKVMMIQFTGIGCGPCQHSYPFLKQLVTDYKNKNFEFVSIETWISDIDALKRYKERNGFNFRFLNSTKEVKSKYQVTGVPVFFILDENRVIRKVVKGYSKEKTDKKIRDILDKLI